MNVYLEDFVQRMFTSPGKALDLGAGEMHDVAGMKQKGWLCEGVDKLMGVDLEKPYLSKQYPFDLVFSNYVLQKLSNRAQLVNTAYQNLKKGGSFFLHTFDMSDKVLTDKGVSMSALRAMCEAQGFLNIATRVFSFYDNEHKHWHRILELRARK